MSKLYTADKFVTTGGTTAQYVTGTGSLVTFPAIPSGADYIQNQNASAQSANMWISGSGIFNSSVTASTFTANDATYGALNFTGGTSSGTVGSFGDSLRLINFTSAGATTIQGNADININSIGSNNIILRTSNTESMRIISSGKVGIGTSSPNEKLTVSGKIYANPQQPVVLSGQGAPYYGTNITLSSDIGSTQGANRIWSRYDGTGSGAITFERSTDSQAYNSDPQLLTYTESMRIAGNGNVGIGTSSPTERLDVNGAIQIRGTRVNNSGEGGFMDYSAGRFRLVSQGQTNTTAGEFLFTVRELDLGGSVDALYIGNTGNVGIGTTNPGSKLQVVGTGRVLNVISANDQAAASFGSNGYAVSTIGFYGVGSANDYNVRVGANVDAFVAYTNDTEKMRITSAGNVGIGTTSPGSLLHMVGTSPELRIASSSDGQTTRLGLYEDTAGTQHGGYIQYVGSGDTLRLGIVNSGTSTDVITVTDTFNVGIGTTSPVNTSGYGGLTVAGSSGSILSMVQGSLETFRVTNATGYSFINTTGHTPLLFGTNATERMRISDPGNVGIGTSDPIDKLEVSSNVSTDSTGLVLTNINNGSNTTKASSILFRLADTAGTIKRSASITSYTEGVNIIDAGLSFKTRTSDADPTEKMRITSTGNVGIGITSPSEKLNVSGNILATGSIKGASIGMTNIVTGYVPYFNGSILDDSPIYTNGGNVGIGTASPSAPLAIGRVNSIEEGGQIDLCRSSDNASSWGIDVFGSTSTPSLRFVDNVASATRMSIDGNGYVGIGITTPIATLDVAGSFRATTGDTFIEVTGAVVNAGNTGDSQMMLEPGVASFGISPSGDFKGVRADADNGVWFHNESGRQFGLSREKNELFAKGNIIQNAQGPGNTTTIVKWIKIYNQDDSSMYFMPLYQ